MVRAPSAAARDVLPCGAVVRRRLERLLNDGAPYSLRAADPWEQYRRGPTPPAAAGTPLYMPADESPWRRPLRADTHAAADFEWLPPQVVGGGAPSERRDCSVALIGALHSRTLGGIVRLHAATALHAGT